MKKLYAPWRSRYINKKSNTVNCVFCKQFVAQKDAEYFIIKRFKYCVVMLNLHPYNAGHILILPYKHTSELCNLTKKEQNELIQVISLSMKIIKQALLCDGVNMGMNSGGASGGSIPEHLHIHIVPRWWGDTNFLVTISDTKQISSNLPDIYKQLIQAFEHTCG